MRVDFTVGEAEQHQMELSFDQASGDLRILMDGTPVLQDSPSITVKPFNYELNVGAEERHRLALQIAYTELPSEPSDPAVQAAPRLSLTVTAIS